ncbi:MAG TPA: hypothetical protein VGD56_13275 [Gemmatirosa sp.]
MPAAPRPTRRAFPDRVRELTAEYDCARVADAASARVVARDILTIGLADARASADVGEPSDDGAELRAWDRHATVDARVRPVLTLVDLVEGPRLGVAALLPALELDPAHHVVSTAALHLAAVHPATTAADPLGGTRDLVARARASVGAGDEARAVAILSGLLLIADRRVVSLLGGCWRDVSSSGREQLVRALEGMRVFAPLVEWLLDWMDDSEGGEFGGVAGIVARLGERARADGVVVETSRALPLWSRPSAEAAVVVRQWTPAEYAAGLRRRLLQLAADETAPRVMYDVLRAWGIESNARWAPGIVMRAPRPDTTRAPLLPRLPTGAAFRTAYFASGRSLRDQDFLTRDGRLLVSWGIFNPYGPTWSCLGLLPTDDPGVDVLFYRMLNPFAQQSLAMGSVHGDDRTSPEALGAMLQHLFRANVIPVFGEDPACMIAGGAPDFVIPVWGDAAFRRAVDDAVRASPRLIELDIGRDLAWRRAFPGDPWARADAQRRLASAAFAADGVAPTPPAPPTTAHVIDEYLRTIAASDHWLPELVQFPAAWHGAIDHVNTPALAQCAYTFWQLDDFVARYGLPIFRALADQLAQAKRRAHGPTDSPSWPD